MFKKKKNKNRQNRQNVNNYNQYAHKYVKQDYRKDFIGRPVKRELKNKLLIK